jgi:hypothetical protein
MFPDIFDCIHVLLFEISVIVHNNTMSEKPFPNVLSDLADLAELADMAANFCLNAGSNIEGK